MIIYLDTVLWNKLYEDQISPSKLIVSLRQKQSFVAVSPFVFYELLKTFSNPANAEKGQKLMAFFAEFVNQAQYVVKDNFLMLPEEVHSVMSGQPVEPFHMPNEIEGFKEVVNRIATGGFKDDDSDSLRIQKDFVEHSRQAAAGFGDAFPDAMKNLRKIPREQLAEFLHRESMTLDGVTFLLGPIKSAFEKLSGEKVDKIARSLLTRPAKRFARGCARAGLYYQWRIAHFGSVPKDVAEDITHILDAVYCDVYATSEAKQAEYADMLVTTKTKIKLFQNDCPVDEWILNLTNLT